MLDVFVFSRENSGDNEEYRGEKDIGDEKG